MRSFKTIQPKDHELKHVQDNVGEFLHQLTRLPILDGILLENIELISGQDNEVPHTLSRPPRMWIVARQDTGTTVWEENSRNPNYFLNLQCSANCKISLWVA